VIEAGRALDDDERELAAVSLQRTHNASQPEIDAAWRDEISRRLGELDHSKVDLVDAAEHALNLRAKYTAPDR